MNMTQQIEIDMNALRDTKLQKWIFRLLLRLETHKQFITPHGFSHQLLADYLQLNLHGIDQQPTYESIIGALNARNTELEQLAQPTSGITADPAIEHLASHLGLNVAETLILEFTLQLHQERLLDDVTEWLGPLTSAKVFRSLAIILNISEGEVRDALGPTSMLTKTGLVNLELNGAHLLRNKLEPFSLTLAERLYSGETDPVRLLQGMINRCDAAHLTLDHYPHVPTLNILRQWLHHAHHSARVGVNILIYGQPGTGKSQLCRLIANELQSTLYEVSSENELLRPLSGSRRLRAWRAAQRFLCSEQALILIDDAEDVFIETPGTLSTVPLSMPKAWINRLLEGNAIPTLWVANDISSMDPALVRRFDMVLELDSPPRAQRAEMLQRASGGLLTSDAISHLADAPWLAPAVIERAGNVIQCVSESLCDEQRRETLMLLINSTLKAQGHTPIKHLVTGKTPALYDTAFINSDTPLDEIDSALSPHHVARFCLYGPPGTGKTAWAYWLAEQLKMPIVERKASALLGRYVGESEGNIAALFEQARRDKALLLIDEVDTFISARDELPSTWQVSCANEMLSQMSQFEGILIATTNRFDVLDAAALRRFDLKVRFNYLCDYQAMALLNLYCRELQLNDPQPAAINDLVKMAYLTPGDFALVARQHRFKRIVSAQAFIAALKTECWMKKRDKPAIGFLH